MISLSVLLRVTLFVVGADMDAAGSVQVSPSLLPMESRVGTELLRQNLTPMATRLMTHFVTQDTPAYCGIASAVMILNAARVSAPADPRSAGYTYFTQQNFFWDTAACGLSRSSISQNGLSLQQLACSISAWGLPATPFKATCLDEESFRDLLRQSVAAGEFVIVNFSRAHLGQLGTGHHSPVLAYSEQDDQVAVLDVARYKERAFWVKTSVLWQAVNTRDAKGNWRGLLIAHSAGLFLTPFADD